MTILKKYFASYLFYSKLFFQLYQLHLKFIFKIDTFHKTMRFQEFKQFFPEIPRLFTIFFPIKVLNLKINYWLQIFWIQICLQRKQKFYSFYIFTILLIVFIGAFLSDKIFVCSFSFLIIASFCLDILMSLNRLSEFF